MNLGHIRHCGIPPGCVIGSEEISDYAGLIRSVPVVAVALVTILVSLIGIPPLAGFIGKFAVFAALVDAGGPIMMSLLVIAGFNTVDLADLLSPRRQDRVHRSRTRNSRSDHVGDPTHSLCFDCGDSRVVLWPPTGLATGSRPASHAAFVPVSFTRQLYQTWGRAICRTSCPPLRTCPTPTRSPR